MKIKLGTANTFSTDQVAIILGVKAATVRSLVHNGKLKLGRAVNKHTGFVIDGLSLHYYLCEDPRYNRADQTFELDDDLTCAYAGATKRKCINEIHGAEAVLKRELNMLDIAIDLLSK